MRVLVTGNQGYIGTVMTQRLADAGLEVWGFDTGYFADCVLTAPGAAGVARQLTGDMRDITRNDLEGVDAVVHLAGLSNDPTGELNPDLTRAINTDASERLALAARSVGVRRFVFASSCSIYGHSALAALTEEAPMNPQTAYARSKVEAEAILHDLATDGFSPTMMRNSTVYGLSPRLRFDLAVNNLTGWGFTTGEVRLLSDGRAWRPMVHVEDLCSACLQVLNAPRETVHNQAVNIGAERENYQIRTIAETVSRVIPGTRVAFAEGASADSRTYNVSFARLRLLLPEYSPQWNVELGIRQLYAALQAASINRDGFESRLFTRLKQLQHLMTSGSLSEDLRWTGASARAA